MAKPDAIRAVRRFCLECQGDSSPAVRACADGECPLHPWRLPAETSALPQSGAAAAPAAPAADAGSSPQVLSQAAREEEAVRKAALAQERQRRQRAALRAVRRQCLVCAGDRREARSCAAKECPLWPLRFGVMPETYKAVRARFFAPKKLTLF